MWGKCRGYPATDRLPVKQTLRAAKPTPTKGENDLVLMLSHNEQHWVSRPIRLFFHHKGSPRRSILIIVTTTLEPHTISDAVPTMHSKCEQNTGSFTNRKPPKEFAKFTKLCKKSLRMPTNSIYIEICCIAKRVCKNVCKKSQFDKACKRVCDTHQFDLH